MYSSWTIIQLKEELKKRNASLRGKKADLVERLELYDKHGNFGNNEAEVEDAMEHPPINTYRDVNTNSSVPPITNIHLRHYLDITKEKLDTAVELYESRHLLILRQSVQKDYTYFKGYCKKTMKTMQYEVDVKINNNGSPEESHCECPAGSGQSATCKHVAVLLLAVENVFRCKTLLLNEVCTQKLQQWNRPHKQYMGTPIRADKLPQKRVSKRISFEPYPLRRINIINYNNRFRNLILNFCNSTMPFKQMYAPANPFAIEADHMYHNKEPKQDLLLELKLVDVSQQEIMNIQEVTQAQRDSKEWYLHRSYRLTASIFHTICHLRDATLNKFANQIMDKKTFNSRATSHGIMNEEVALAKYCAEFGLLVQPCGFFISKERPYLGSSPDGLLGPDTVIEIKCPYSSRMKMISLETVPYLKEENNLLALKTSSPYYYQIQGQLYCTNRAYCNMIIYTYKDLKVVFVNRDQTFIDNMLLKLDNFYYKYFQQVIFNKYLYYNYDRFVK